MSDSEQGAGRDGLRLAVIRRIGGGICLFFALLLALDLLGVDLPSWLPV